MPVFLHVEKTEGKPGQVYFPLRIKETPKPTPGPGELLVRIRAAALNHRDLFIRQNLYPGISFDNPLLADGFGIVEEVGSGCKRTEVAKVGAGVVLVPCRNWTSDPIGPERTDFSAIAATQLAVAHGCRVYVTSGDPAKLQRASAELGVSGGVSYRDADWDKQLLKLLPKDRPYLDAIIDGAGGDIVKRGCRLLRTGGVISSYGMTVAPKMDWLMSAVLRNIDLKGSTMGSRDEFRAMVKFVRDKQIRPVVSRVVYGGLTEANLPAIETLFDDIKAGRQFGKLVLSFDKEPSADSPAKL